ncbi:transposase [Rhodothermus marinus]|uniref:transposase n=1 Tax=Rhodothermus marinus TaxID=29549 RepID=UPI0012BA3B20|nr:transposase [Rhodothermus marinus]BBM69293.1 hypothetical protein RmaAA213_11390 [Rhodothermus marinus]BBM72285.1 hypothetical protein RmaAA338_11500 [Rhodothermus marinus]
MTYYKFQRHHRRSIRLKGYDYTQPGAYFVTICTHGRAPLFGDVVDWEMRLNDMGEIVRACWHEIPDHFQHVELDAFVVMPNHVHCIVCIVDNVGATHASPLHASPRRNKPRGPAPGSIGAIVGAFKSAVTQRINQRCGTPGTSVWQRNYYEHIIRTERALNAIRRYIAENPLHWHLDRYNPYATGTDPQAWEIWQMIKEDAQTVRRRAASPLREASHDLI